MKLLVQSSEKFLSMIQSLIKETYPKFITFDSFLKISKKNLKIIKKNFLTFIWILKSQRIDLEEKNL